MNAVVTAVSRSATHTVTKRSEPSIALVAGLGVRGDAHSGPTVQHLSRLPLTPNEPNLRQVHLLHEELHEELRAVGFTVQPGLLGGNVTTRGVDLLALPTGARLGLGDTAVVGIQPGLLAATVGRDEDGDVIRKAGVMGVVVVSGDVRPGDRIRLELPPAPHSPLEPV